MAAFLASAGFCFLIWILYRVITTNKEAFSKDNLNRSFKTLGFLALLLIFVVGLVVVWLRQGHA